MERHCKNNEELFASQVVYHWIQLHDLNAEQITETQTFEMKTFALSVARALDTQCSSNETQPATATQPMVQAEGTNLEGPDAEPVEIDATSVANGNAVTNETNTQKLKAHASEKLNLQNSKKRRTADLVNEPAKTQPADATEVANSPNVGPLEMWKLSEDTKLMASRRKRLWH